MSVLRPVGSSVLRGLLRPIGVARGSSGVAVQNLLDQVPDAGIAFSLRKLRSDYTGSAIRVRRSSDNTEQDIGFVAGSLDTASLLSFCGAGNGFVRTWYDQSGNDRHATQTTSGSQPKIVTSGSVELQADLPTINFAGTGFLTVPSFSFSNFSLIVTEQVPSDVFKISFQSSSILSLYIAATTNESAYMYAGSGNGLVLPERTFVDLQVSTFHRNSTGGTVNLGAEGRYKQFALSASTINTTYLIGGEGGFLWTGVISELVLWPSFISGFSDAVQNTQAAYGLTEEYNEQFIALDFTGDSLTAGTSGSPPPTSPYPALVDVTLDAGKISQTRNFGGAGRTFYGGGGYGPIANPNPAPGSWSKKVLVVWGGTNDLYFGRTGAEAYADWETFCTAAKTRYDYVIAIDCIKRFQGDQPADFETQRLAFNASLAADAETIVDALVLASDMPEFFTDDPAYYSDHVHITDAGNALIAAAVEAEIQAYVDSL